jgi:GDP-L-fucose synthase
MLAMEKMPAAGPINLGSGRGTSIRELVETILRVLGGKIDVVWDTSKPSGDQVRIMDISRAHAIGFEPSVDLESGVRETIEWYRENLSAGGQRYDVFGKA